eukprot:symbB.v1.2.028803.t3/scaffold3088.1/size63905/3
MCSALTGNIDAKVKRHFCQSCGSTCLVSLHLDKEARCSLLPAGVLSDKDFPKGFSPKLKDCGTQSPAPFGPLTGMASNLSAAPPIFGSCLCGSCRFRTCRYETSRPPREMQHCHCSTCRQMSGAAYQTWTPVDRNSLEWIKPNKLKVIRASSNETPLGNGANMRKFCGFKLVLAAVVYANEPCCCGDACKEGRCSSQHDDFQAQIFGAPCQKLLDQQTCETQFVCTWTGSPKVCEDCEPKCNPSCLEKYLEGFPEFRRFSAATLHMIEGDAAKSFNAREEALQVHGGSQAYRERMHVTDATDDMLMISDAAMKVLNCWALSGRFWYVYLQNPGLGLRSSTMHLEDVESYLVAPYFNSVASTTQSAMENITSQEVSHWADLPLDFALIGLDGCGTTSLRRNLAKHPDLNFTSLKVFGQDGSDTYGSNHDQKQDEDYFLIEMARQTLPFMKQVQKLVRHRAPMRKAKVGIYNPLMWKEELLEHLLGNIPNLRVVVAVCDPLDRFERKMDLEVVRKGGNAEGREFLKLVTEFIESEARSIYFQIPVASWVKNYGHQILLIEKDMQGAPETLRRITDFLDIRPFPQHVRFKRYNSRGGKHSRFCSNAKLLESLKVSFEPEYQQLEEILGASHASQRLRARQSRHATREFCQDCGSALTIIYSGQTNTIWLSAAAYDLTAWGRTEHCESMHICVDSAPPWHLPHTWARDGLKRVKDVCEEEADEGAEDSEEEDYQLQQALQLSRLEGDAFSSASSSKPFKPRFNPQLALLQEMTNCSLFEAEQVRIPIPNRRVIHPGADELKACRKHENRTILLAQATRFRQSCFTSVAFAFTMALPMKSMKSVMKSAMKSMKAMKIAMKAKTMKTKRVSKVAKGKRAKVVVFKGNKEKTASGIAKKDLMKNKTGKIVTKKSHAAGVKAYKQISAWTIACQGARKELGIKGFCPVGGKTAQGKALYAKAKAIYAA